LCAKPKDSKLLYNECQTHIKRGVYVVVEKEITDSELKKAVGRYQEEFPK
jgi:hypothetical protein